MSYPISNEHPLNVCKTEDRNPARKVAVLACHGMGQQVCYQTLDLIASALINEGEKRGATVTDRAARVVKIGDQRLGRFELEIQTETTKKVVHLYEAYWAPFTQGAITLWEVVTFLFKSGLNGMRQWAEDGGCFKYRAFGEEQKVPISARTPLALASLISFVGLLLITSLTLPVLTLAGVLRSSLHLPEAFCHAIVLAVVWLWLAAAPAILSVFLSGVLAAVQPVFSLIVKIRWLVMFGAWVLLACLIRLWFDETRTQVGEFAKALSTGTSAFVILLLTPVVLYGWYRLRYFLVEFMGDVAIYVSAYTIDRFWKIRDQIQNICADVALAIYKEKLDATGEFAYDEVIMIGHSLGSVVAYNALNRVLVEDRLEGDSSAAAERTSLFFTIGSPLDKVTYLFRSQLGDASVRDAVDAAWAPMTSCPETRSKIRWVNVFSSADQISGELNYFDPYRNENGVRCVENIREEMRFDRPASAHTDYWTRPTFRKILFDAILTGPVHRDNEREVAAAAGGGR